MGKKKKVKVSKCECCGEMYKGEPEKCQCGHEEFEEIYMSEKAVARLLEEKKKEIEVDEIRKPSINTVFYLDEVDGEHVIYWSTLEEAERGEMYFLDEKTGAKTVFDTKEEALAFIEGMVFATHKLWIEGYA